LIVERFRRILPPGMYMRTWASILAFWLAALPAAAQTLRVTVIDVDQGAATLFVAPNGRALLVDTGNNGHGSRLKAAMQRAGVAQVDELVITHYHSDHYGGADDLVSPPGPVAVVNVHDRGDKTFLPASKRAEPTYIGYETALGHRAHHLMRGETINLDPSMLVTCVASGSVVLGEAPIHHGPDENDISIGLLIQFGNFRYFVGGDMHGHTEDKIAAQDLVMDVDVYQADHHGSHTSTADNLLADMKPTLVVISNGNDGGYQHPRLVTLNKFAAMTPHPTVLQTNKYLKGGDGANVPDEFIADLVPAGAEGDIVLTVEPDGAYLASYRGMTRQFQSKPRTATAGPAVSIVSLLPNPVGEDRDLEEVELRNNTAAALDLTSWFLRDASGRVWALSSLGQLAAGASATIQRGGMAMSLDNGGDTIEVINDLGAVVNHVTYGTTSEGVRIQL
jgi:beta-lactamase superfamily II metal-dependent hydrolase